MRSSKKQETKQELFTVYCTTKIDNPHLKFVSAAVSPTVDLTISICALEFERVFQGAELFRKEFN